jgi:hypothetical protein
VSEELRLLRSFGNFPWCFFILSKKEGGKPKTMSRGSSYEAYTSGAASKDRPEMLDAERVVFLVVVGLSLVGLDF